MLKADVAAVAMIRVMGRFAAGVTPVTAVPRVRLWGGVRIGDAAVGDAAAGGVVPVPAIARVKGGYDSFTASPILADQTGSATIRIPYPFCFVCLSNLEPRGYRRYIQPRAQTIVRDESSPTHALLYALDSHAPQIILA